MKKTHFLVVAALLLSALSPASRAEEKSACLEGFDPAAPKAAPFIDKYTNYEKKQTPSLWEYPLDGTLTLTWTSQPVPDGLRGKPVMFAIEAGLGASKGADGWHELSVNGKKILRFNTPYGEKLVWRDHDCTVTFHALLVDGNDDLIGIMYLEIAPAYLNYGQPQTFSVRGENNNAKNWFMLFEGGIMPDNPGRIQLGNKVGRRIAGIKSVAPEMPAEYIAKWRGRKAAAWSASAAPVNSPDAVNVTVAGKSDSALRQEIEDAIAGQRWINEVYPDQQALQQISAGHVEWLKKLDCVLWVSSPGEIRRYAELRKKLKVEVVSKDESRHLVTIAPSGDAVSLTVQVPLPKSAWDAEVYTDGARTDSGCIYLKEDKGVSFDLKPGQSAEIRLKQ
ncbi:MAG: hypothetical protein WCV67_01045 [Victivallaceae bacterium]|jgi:hypothetical protein